jgi:MOSC domain-containing protein YiiM
MSPMLWNARKQVGCPLVSTGRVEGIFVAAESGELPRPVDRIRALAGKGLEGNRYFWAEGEAPAGRALTLVAAEALAESGLDITAAETRRNVLTSGVDVNALVGKRFRIGALECYGVELCEPCSHLQTLTGKDVLGTLVHRAGLNVDIVGDGEIVVGDAVTVT